MLKLGKKKLAKKGETKSPLLYICGEMVLSQKYYLLRSQFTLETMYIF